MSDSPAREPELVRMRPSPTALREEAHLLRQHRHGCDFFFRADRVDEVEQAAAHLDAAADRIEALEWEREHVIYVLNMYADSLVHENLTASGLLLSIIEAEET